MKCHSIKEKVMVACKRGIQSSRDNTNYDEEIGPTTFDLVLNTLSIASFPSVILSTKNQQRIVSIISKFYNEQTKQETLM
jgi:hypothetical protein